MENKEIDWSEIFIGFFAFIFGVLIVLLITK